MVGADAMHVALRDILRHLGHRQGITEPGEDSAASADGEVTDEVEIQGRK